LLRAVLFDWGDTLMEWAWDPERLVAGHEAGLRAIGREGPAITDRFNEAYMPLIFRPGVVEEIEYPELVRQLLGEFGVAVDDAQLAAFLEAEHAVWNDAHRLAATTHALLDALRADGLKLGLVSNAFDPPELLHADLARMGIAERLDAAVFSSEVGRRKPDPAIFRAALERLGVAPEEALHVGDRLYEDVRGASALGIRTVQALWFRADEHAEGGEPDYRAFTQMDVLDIARRLAPQGR
jgi:putative hydrolase of the HAD superfamily